MHVCVVKKAFMSLPLLEAEEKGEGNVLECLATTEADLGVKLLRRPRGAQF